MSVTPVRNTDDHQFCPIAAKTTPPHLPNSLDQLQLSGIARHSINILLVPKFFFTQRTQDISCYVKPQRDMGDYRI